MHLPGDTFQMYLYIAFMGLSFQRFVSSEKYMVSDHTA
jgi:hypothetical protein